ncbi:MAG: FAD-binding oxidoreductase, partial [Chloroflexi bacterium]|nr:FAD-binding oxidoreductase [Chloroflexota bacterium]
MHSSIVAQLTAILGPDAGVADDLLGGYAVDGLVPQTAIRPATRQAVSQTMAWAFSENLAVLPRGGGTQMALGNIPGKMDLVLDLRRLDAVLDFQPEDLTVTVEAGIALTTLQDALAQGGMFLPLEAPLAQKATAGGILAANTSGPRRFAYGLPRDWLIGIAVVSANGTETKAGGKVVKNVTGYDLNRLYTGSLGTLGVIVEATFKLAPLPAHSQALAAPFDSIGAALEAGRDLLDQPYSPQGVQVLNGEASRLLEKPGDGQPLVLALFEGPSTELVERRAQECSRMLQQADAIGVTSLNGPQYSSILDRITDLGWSGDPEPYLTIKINVSPSQVAGLVEEIQRDSPLGPPPGIVADVGFGMVRLFWWLGGDPDTPIAFDEPATLAAIHRVRGLASGGSAIVERCPPAIKRDID